MSRAAAAAGTPCAPPSLRTTQNDVGRSEVIRNWRNGQAYRRTQDPSTLLIINHDNGTRRLGPVLGSWVGARHRLPPFLIPTRAPHGFTQDPSTEARGAPSPLTSAAVYACMSTCLWSNCGLRFKDECFRFSGERITIICCTWECARRRPRRWDGLEHNPQYKGYSSTYLAMGFANLRAGT